MALDRPATAARQLSPAASGSAVALARCLVQQSTSRPGNAGSKHAHPTIASEPTRAAPLGRRTMARQPMVG